MIYPQCWRLSACLCCVCAMQLPVFACTVLQCDCLYCVHVRQSVESLCFFIDGLFMFLDCVMIFSFFRDKNYDDAVEMYSKAIYFCPLDDEHKEQMVDIASHSFYCGILSESMANVVVIFVFRRCFMEIVLLPMLQWKIMN